MARVNQKIKEKHKLYVELVNKIKTAVDTYVSLMPGAGSHKKWLSGETQLNFARSIKGKLSVRQARDQLVDYGFQIFAAVFEKPILRFDADGATHYNSRDEKIPLLDREIKTPHYHKYDKHGVEYAYKTALLIEKEIEVQNNIQLGLNYFCHENQIRSNANEYQIKSGTFVKIKTQQELFPELISNDVHKGITFP